MARVAVIGGGFGGLAAAARLAKLGHEVTLLERSPRLGGALSTVEADGFAWDAGPGWTLVPAVLRDLFRKTGRPLEQELELVPVEPMREHRFEDESVLTLPGGTRAAQRDAVDALAPGLGERWVEHVASYAEDWEVLRHHYFEAPWTPDALPPEVADRLDSRENLRRRLRRAFKDDRLVDVAGHPFVAEGHDLRNVPAWLGLVSYLEQQFGAWTVRGGMAAVTSVLTERLATRGVEVLVDSDARDLVVRDGRAVGVLTAAGTVAAEVVVCAVDPRRLPALAAYVAHTMPAIPPVVCHLGLEGELPALPPEVVLHGDPLLVVRPGGSAPAGAAAWTVHGRGRVAEDMVLTLARRGLRVRDQVVARVDVTPRQQVEQWGGSPMGVLWQGRATVRRRLGPRTPLRNVYAAGAHATPGAGLAFVGLSAALVAQCVGPA